MSLLDRKISHGSLLRFAMPTILSYVFVNIYFIIDGIFVSHALGTAALAAVNISMPVIGVVLALATMIGTGGSALIASMIGEGKVKEARQNFSLLEAYNEGLAYAKERQQFGEAIINFPAVYDMLSRMKAKLDAGRSLLYETACYVDVYKCLEDIERDRKLEPEEKQELKKYQRLADAFTPLAKGMNSEYANQNAYDAISIHGGSGFIMEYKSQRLFRDARIFSIYEGTTQLQVVAAIRYITNGTMLNNIKAMVEEYRQLSTVNCQLLERIERLIPVYEEALANVKALENQDAQDFLARRLYDMTAELVMSLLIIRDAAKAPELFAKSAQVYVRMTEEDVFGKSAYIKVFQVEDLENFKAASE